MSCDCLETVQVEQCLLAMSPYDDDIYVYSTRKRIAANLRWQPGFHMRDVTQWPTPPWRLSS